MYITVAHLIPIEIIFAVVSHYYVEWATSVLFVNYIYGCVVVLHGIGFMKNKLHRYINTADRAEYIMNTVFKPKPKPIADDIIIADGKTGLYISADAELCKVKL